MFQFLAYAGFYGYTITDILNQWAQFGVFAYVFPFLLIFAIVFGILNKSNILGENKAVHATIALAVGFLALQNDYVTRFFESIFPYAGMGIAVLLVALILMGVMFGETEMKWLQYVFFGIGAIIFLIVILTSLNDISWWGMGGYGWGQSWPAILSLIILLGIMAFIIFGSKKSGSHS
jgi:hypothetical protein